MTDPCKPNAFTLYQGYSSVWDGVDWLALTFSSDTMVDFTGFSAKLKIGEFVFENNDLSQEWIINLTASQTAKLPVGMNNATLIVYDVAGEGKPFSTNIPIFVKNWEDGDVEIDTYKATITATLNDRSVLNIKVETARVTLDWVDGRISEHNLSENAHPYIQNLIASERTARENADTQLQTNINNERIRAQNSEDALGDDLINERNMRIAQDNALYGVILDEEDRAENAERGLARDLLNETNRAKGIENGLRTDLDSHVNNGNIHVTLQDKQRWNGKQDAIADLNTIRSNAQAGKNASQTIAGYGNIVTHNVSEFATSEQGAKADSALQQTDIVNNTSSTATNKALSANMGKSLQEQVDNLKARGRFLALWNCATGLAESNPPSGTYTYQSGDYFIVGTVASVGGTNYKPNGSSYTTGVASTTVETQAVDVDDVYYYDGHVWRLQVNTQKEIGFVNIAGSPYDNSNLAAALNWKISGVKVNGVELTPDSNHKVDVSVPTESTVSGWGFTKNVGTVTSVNNVSPVNGNVSISIPTSDDYWTVGTYGDYYQLQETYLPKRIEYMPNEDGQDYGLAVMSANPTFEYVPYAGTWNGRMLVGNVDRSFLLGTATSNGSTTADMCCIGAHTWSPNLAWDDIYLNTDGNKTVYIGGNNWTKNSGWFKVENSGSNSGGKVQVNIGTITDAVWKDVGIVKSVNNASPDSSGNVTITIPDPLPSQTGQSGKFLSTNGTAASWDVVNAGIFYWGE